MEIVRDDKVKIIEIWLTKQEAADKVLRESLRPIYAQFSAAKYTVAVFESGDRDLYESTNDLLLHNLMM